jgi:hypothetical protein
MLAFSGNEESSSYINCVTSIRPSSIIIGSDTEASSPALPGKCRILAFRVSFSGRSSSWSRRSAGSNNSSTRSRPLCYDCCRRDLGKRQRTCQATQVEKHVAEGDTRLGFNWKGELGGNAVLLSNTDIASVSYKCYARPSWNWRGSDATF